MSNTKKLVTASVLLAIGLLLPQVFHIIPGNLTGIISPMHLPAFFAGLILGPFYGALVGMLIPLLSSIITGMPPLMPIAACMMVEIGIYGLVCGLLIKKFNIFVALLIAIVAGRIGYVSALSLIQGITSIEIWWANLIANFTGGIFAIMIQFILIPLLVPRIQKALESSNH